MTTFISRSYLRSTIGLLPMALFTLVLLGLVVMRLEMGVVVPFWLAWTIGLCWMLLFVDLLLRFEVVKQVGGLLVLLFVVLILVGALVPYEQAEKAPRVASEQLTYAFESTWNAVYQGQLFKKFSPKQMTIDSLRSIADINPFRTGKMVLFGLLGFFVGVSYLFPVTPPGRRVEERATALRYVHRLLVVAGVLGAFALHVELLQVLTRTRTLQGVNAIENLFGVWAGLALFVPIQFVYAWLADHRRRGSPRFNVLGVGVDAADMTDCIARFESIIRADPPAPTPAMACALGVAGIISARRDPKLQHILNRSVLNTADGMPLVWLGKLYGYRHIERVYGPDLLRDVCAYSADKGWRHYFYGAAPGIVDKLKIKLEEKYPGIQVVGTHCPPFRPLTEEEERALLAEVEQAKPDIFWIGISTPKQLYMMDEFRRKLSCKIICPVGYAFDVNAGVEMDAPDWIKYAGLQWLHRGIKQPRLWKRYLPDNPRFVFEVCLQILRLKKYPMATAEGGDG
jgi:N-acetylglucosaminyldiphosphoundecaprenol N-acetyl-beta-D-mannosaminyltransferase